MAVFRKLKKLITPLLGPLLFLVLLLIIRYQNHNNVSEFDKRLRDYSQSDKKDAGEERAVTHKFSVTTTTIQTTEKPRSEQAKLDERLNDMKKKKYMVKRPLVEMYSDKDDLATGFINDTDVIEALASYHFMMRSEADENFVKQRYLGGEGEYTKYKAICGNISYNLSSLPTASVIISFHQNERVESILHTLHSIHLNSPPELLKEVILIDDNSKKASHKEALDSYVKNHFPTGFIKIHRHPGPDQLGLIKGRLLGIKMATGEVVVCMDAHMELQPRWLEPLLQAIYDQRNTMATSHLDWMRPLDEDPTKWSYEHGFHKAKTTWVWKSFNFGFRSIRMRDVNHNRFSTMPIECPMSVGTIWAMDRSFFFEIGGFDESMVLWGAENIDLPIRIHLCSGGRVVNIPCSKAAHQEMRHQRDYRKGWRNNFDINFKRLAEVWLDGEYKETFDFHNQHLQYVDPGDLTERYELKKRCPRNFSYYIEKTFPEMGVDAISFAWQGVLNLATKKCFYYSTDTHNMKLSKCHREYSKEQAVFLNIHGQLRQYLSIFNIDKQRDRYNLVRDDYFYEYFHSEKYTRWMHTKDGCIYSPYYNLCLGENEDKLKLFPCNGTCTLPHMQWKFKKYTHYYKELWDGHLVVQKTENHREEKSEKYHESYAEYLHSHGKPVVQSDIDNSEKNFWKFLIYGKETL